MTWPRRRRPSGPSRSMNLPIAVQAALDDAAPGSSWIWAEDDPSLPNALSAPPDLDNTERRHQRRGVVQINEYFAAHPEMVLGTHAQRRGIYGPGLC